MQCVNSFLVDLYKLSKSILGNCFTHFGIPPEVLPWNSWESFLRLLENNYYAFFGEAPLDAGRAARWGKIEQNIIFIIKYVLINFR